jgi:hypothetical protein
MIVDNEAPKWISVMKLPEKFNDVIIAKIDRDRLRRDSAANKNIERPIDLYP